ncbi:hypothetical protein SMC26_42280 [Actinomadura fulvescens]|uniref:Secreted protein n=1 Tax=Actinomadura fulvescens TaxID=46160 RepID=A0ABP6DAI7_9ACTN
MAATRTTVLGIAAVACGASLLAAPPAQAHSQATGTPLAVSSVNDTTRTGGEPAKIAHRASKFKTRARCTWFFVSDHTSAGTRRVDGSCKGYSWIYVQSNRGWKSGWRAGRVVAGVTVPRGHKIRYSWHKTQRYETAHLFKHKT